MGASRAPDPELARAAAHVFVQDLELPTLTEADAHHLARTLRLRAGESVTASDGKGSWRRCVWRGDAVRGPSDLELDGPVVFEEALAPLITIGFALTKGDRPEAVVRGLTEVGVNRIQPLIAARSVVRWDAARAEHHLSRLRRVAIEAAMQSRRTWLPLVGPLLSLAEVASPSATMAAPGGGPVVLIRPTILVGPEGGWDDAELACGLDLVGLGATVLRAETAALAAGVVLCSLRSGALREG